MKKIINLFLVVLICVAYYGLIDKSVNREFDFNKVVFENECFLSEKNGIVDITKNINELEKYQVVIEFIDKYEVAAKPDKEITMDEAKEYIKNNRNKTKEFYSEYNNKLCKELMINDLSDDIEISKYSPFVFVNINDNSKNDMILSKIDDLAKSKEIKKIYVKTVENWKNEIGHDVFFEVNQGGGGGSSPTYTGEGVVMGILDPGIVIASNPNFADVNLTIRDEWYYIESESEHATTVASIAGGANGIAPGADILSVEVCAGLSSEVEWLLDNDVNVVNMSFVDSTTSSSLGNYTSNAAYIDSIVRNNYVTFVGSAGNRGDGDAYITSPKTGYNVIAVGSTNADGTVLSSFSSFKEKFTVSKPNLVARGEDYTIAEIGDQGSGTSYASPVVTGTIALMMEKRPYLMLYPELIMPIITASADNIEGYSSKNSDGFNDKVGAGFINIQAALDNVYNTTNFIYTTQDESGIFVSEKLVTIGANGTIKISFASLVNTDGSAETNKVTDYDLRLYTSAGSYIAGISSLSNTELLEYTSQSGGNYIIKIYLYSAKKTELTDYCGYAYKIS